MNSCREKANERERNRQKSIGNAFDVLRNRLPKQLRDRKPSKAATLKSAAQYISHLQRVLEVQLQEKQKINFNDKTAPNEKEDDYVRQETIWIPPEYKN